MNNAPQGEGKFICKSYTYEGNWFNGYKHGKGTITFPNTNTKYL